RILLHTYQDPIAASGYLKIKKERRDAGQKNSALGFIFHIEKFMSHLFIAPSKKFCYLDLHTTAGTSFISPVTHLGRTYGMGTKRSVGR
ncbi:MAG: hypothetical protein P8X46_08935, partial [Nitrospirales bacterium]